MLVGHRGASDSPPGVGHYFAGAPDEWADAGVFDALADEALRAYDRIVGPLDRDRGGRVDPQGALRRPPAKALLTGANRASGRFSQTAVPVMLGRVPTGRKRCARQARQPNRRRRRRADQTSWRWRPCIWTAGTALSRPSACRPTHRRRFSHQESRWDCAGFHRERTNSWLSSGSYASNTDPGVGFPSGSHQKGSSRSRHRELPGASFSA